MISELANHLWQSTLFAVAVGLLTSMCRKNHAGVRYWLWFSASLKFFIPFTLLMALSERLEWASRAPQIAAPAVSAALAQVSRPFIEDSAPGIFSVPEAPRGFDWFALAVLAVWVPGILAMTVVRFRMWRRIRAAVRASSPWAVPSLPMLAGIDVRSTPGVMEPGVVGLWRPVMLVPSGLEDDLTPRQLAAVLLHERCHIQRRDNMTAAVHMIAEAVFWFYPLVWWIGARLVEERERACDEEVLRTSGEPQTYAEGIVTVCRRYVESPLACVSGVSGANVKNRIREIMTNRTIAKLSVAQKVVLVGVGVIAVVTPILAQSVPLPSAAERFAVASIKRNQGGMAIRVNVTPAGGFEGIGMTLESVIRYAYGLREHQAVGFPDWVRTDRFDIQARAPEGAPASDPGENRNQVLRRLQSLLAERFALKAHRETRDRPIYALMRTRADGSLGPQLRQSKLDCETILAARKANTAPPSFPETGERPQCGLMLTPDGTMFGDGTTMAQLINFLQLFADRMIIDRTGLTAGFDFDLRFAGTPVPGAGLAGAAGRLPFTEQPADPDRVSLFTALEEQLGLKLEAQTGPVEVLVIDHVEQPTPN